MVGSNKQTLTILDNRTGKTITVAIKDNAINAIDLKKLAAPYEEGERRENDTEGGLRILDTGFQNTAAITSKITYIDGENGILRYRGYPIEILADSSNFLETSYLLIYGELPTKEQYDLFSNVEQIVATFRYDSHPMAIFISSLAALGAFAPEANPSLIGQSCYTKVASGDKAALKLMDKQIFRIMGKVITIAAMSFRVRQGRNFNLPPPNASYTTTFLYLLDHLNETNYLPNQTLAKALDTLFLLHADHELNCSTATMLQAGSSLVDPYSCIAAATAALYGPSHGGAAQACVVMLLEIGDAKNVPAFLERVKRKEVVLSGFGHRVYRKTDPRSIIIEKTAEEVFKVTGRDPLIDTALALRDLALKDDYFISRRLFANVDFFSGLIYKAMGFPLDFFPVLFAVPRTAGWLAHWRQMMMMPSVKIWRPRQLYLGEGERPYVSIEDRKNLSSDPRNEPTIVDHFFSTRAKL